MIPGLLLLLFAIYNLSQIIYRTTQIREFGVPIGIHVAWILSVATAFTMIVAAIVPAMMLSFPIIKLPSALVLFLPAVVLGRTVQNRLIVQGTSRTEPVEKAAANSVWLGVFAIASFGLGWLISIMSTSTSAAPRV